MKVWKRFGALALSAAMVMGMAACGSDSGSSTDTQAEIPELMTALRQRMRGTGDEGGSASGALL